MNIWENTDFPGTYLKILLLQQLKLCNYVYSKKK